LDIKFNSMKSQLITFGGENPNQCSVTLNGTQIPWVTRVKYLGVYIVSNSGLIYQMLVENSMDNLIT